MNWLTVSYIQLIYALSNLKYMHYHWNCFGATHMHCCYSFALYSFLCKLLQRFCFSVHAVVPEWVNVCVLCNLGICHTSRRRGSLSRKSADSRLTHMQAETIAPPTVRSWPTSPRRRVPSRISLNTENDDLLPSTSAEAFRRNQLLHCENHLRGSSTSLIMPDNPSEKSYQFQRSTSLVGGLDGQRARSGPPAGLYSYTGMFWDYYGYLPYHLPFTHYMPLYKYVFLFISICDKAPRPHRPTVRVVTFMK